nr:MAG TPA: hypothetical protein [Caudoviricetes sp.]
MILRLSSVTSFLAMLPMNTHGTQLRKKCK